MGFFSAMRLGSLYDERIKAYGFEPRSLPPDLHSTICSSFEREAEQNANTLRFVGSERKEFIETRIELAADLVVLCCIGPTLFKKQVGHDYTNGIIRDLAKSWVNSGPTGSLKLQVLNAINQCGHLNIEFANAFIAERARQESEKDKRAAEQGNADAQRLLSLLPMGVKETKLAAEQGNADAQWWLGSMYMLGAGVLKDVKEAGRWYQLAADQGHAGAKTELIRMWTEGQRGHLRTELARWNNK